jgi:hypothetical protein
VRVFKHDFFAATCLYHAEDGDPPRIVVKFSRTQGFCGLPLRWLGRWLSDHEQAVYRRLEGVEGIPRWVDRLDETSYAIEYLDARPLDHLDRPPRGYFERLRSVFDALHGRGVSYGDGNKRSNLLVGQGGEAYLIDFQLALLRRDELPWPVSTALRALVGYISDRDLYHLYKHKRHLSPDELTDEQRELSSRRGPLHQLHRRLTKPYRALRRRFLRNQHRSGRLQSPSARLEDHHQPEKGSWRT